MNKNTMTTRYADHVCLCGHKRMDHEFPAGKCRKCQCSMFYQGKKQGKKETQMIDFASMTDSDLVAWMVEDQRKLIAAQERYKHNPLALSTTPEHRANTDCAYAELLRRNLVPEVNRHFKEI